jgi:hypothetical protein
MTNFSKPQLRGFEVVAALRAVAAACSSWEGSCGCVWLGRAVEAGRSEEELLVGRGKVVACFRWPRFGVTDVEIWQGMTDTTTPE